MCVYVCVCVRVFKGKGGRRIDGGRGMNDTPSEYTRKDRGRVGVSESGEMVGRGGSGRE